MGTKFGDLKRCYFVISCLGIATSEKTGEAKCPPPPKKKKKRERRRKGGGGVVPTSAPGFTIDLLLVGTNLNDLLKEQPANSWALAVLP